MKITEGFNYIRLKHFDIKTLEIESKLLTKTAFNSSQLQKHILLIPKKAKEASVVFILAGFGSTSPGYFNLKKLKIENFPQMIDTNFEKIPDAVYVFVDAMSDIGGTQFVNSTLVGRFEDHIIKELCPIIKNEFCNNHDKWAIMGGSSGGYGALHLSTKYSVFKHVGAIAPDSFFEACYLPDLYKILPVIKKHGLEDIMEMALDGEISDFDVLCSLAMIACYSEKKKFPIDLNTWKLKSEVWKKWKSFDPVVFLLDRSENIKKLKSVFIECGSLDEFNLQFGARQIDKILKSYNFKYHYEEFEGFHSEISSRRLGLLTWLSDRLKGL